MFARVGIVDPVEALEDPVLLGDGIPLFGSLPADVALTHVETQSFSSGLVQSRYRIEG